MDIEITEVHITCFILMGLMTIFLLGILPRYTKTGKVLNNARKLLGGSTLFVTLHFLIQYFLHKHVVDVSELRSVINLLFGIPISYFSYLSYLYLQRRGQIRKIEWFFGPVVLLVLTFVYTASFVSAKDGLTLHVANYVGALLYALVLFYYCVLQIREYLHILKTIRDGDNHIFMTLLKWTKWSMFLIVFIGLGFPLMTFNPNMLIRSVYGILSISAAFFYIINFIVYSFVCAANENAMTQESQKKGTEEVPRGLQLNEQKVEKMNNAVKLFIESGYYQKSGITLKDVANEMGVSCNMLKIWLRSTEYEKFNSWILHLRIQKAKELLLNNPDLSSEEIAEKCGFCDRQYFQLQFAKLEGVSPAKWLKQCQINS